MWSLWEYVYTFYHVSSILAQTQYIYAHFLNPEICSLWFYHAHVLEKILKLYTQMKINKPKFLKIVPLAL